MTNQIDADGISTFYLYNAKGELEYTVLDLDLGSCDRVTRTGKPI